MRWVGRKCRLIIVAHADRASSGHLNGGLSFAPASRTFPRSINQVGRIFLSASRVTLAHFRGRSTPLLMAGGMEPPHNTTRDDRRRFGSRYLCHNHTVSVTTEKSAQRSSLPRPRLENPPSSRCARNKRHSTAHHGTACSARRTARILPNRTAARNSRRVG